MNLKLALAILSVFALLKGGQTTFARTSAAAAETDIFAEVTSEQKPESTDASDSSGDGRNPYAVITDRNVFRLTDPPKPPAIEPPVIIPTIKLTGLVKMAGQQTRALFVSVPKDPKETILYFNLAEGERQDDLEVVKILETEEAAEVMNSGTKMTVKLNDSKDNKLPPGAPNPNTGVLVRGGGIPPPVMPQPQPAQPQQLQQPPDQQPPPQSRSSVMVAGGTPTPPPTVPSAAPATAPPAFPGRTIPLRTLRSQIPPPPMPMPMPGNP